MEVTYIAHSGFFLDVGDAGFLFDYYKGKLPDMGKDKPLVVFVSHWHPDHYNPEIFALAKKYPQVHYVLSKDVHFQRAVSEYQQQGVELSGKITVCPRDSVQELMLEGGQLLHITSLRSTDEGVAYLLAYEGRTIYHAGDLNRWVWKEESKAYNNNMESNYRRELEKLRGKKIDVAFVPLDPRQREEAFGGMELFLEYTESRIVFPMHFWTKYRIIHKFCEAHPEYAEQIVRIQRRGQRFSLAE
ncbi:MAG: MBL fold metallo-hydrolase [Lachnospiraceae bacterium]|nr:MBL fold metallo-hydrolase [Lachnospiraceae bacterium]